MNIFNRNPQKKWEKLKSNSAVFPKTKIAVVGEKFEDGEFRTAWVNTGYKNYPYKKFCPVLGVLEIDFEDMGEFDAGEIQQYFDKEFNKACVSHLISRITTDTGIEILFYFENQEVILDKIEKLYKSENKLVDFGCGLHSDPEWKP